MTWDYRVVKTISNGEEYYSIHEAYYNEEDQASSITEDPVEAFGNSLEELKLDLERMLEALNKPVLIGKDFEPGTLISETNKQQ